MATTAQGDTTAPKKSTGLNDIGRINFTIDKAKEEKYSFAEINLSNLSRIANALERQNELLDLNTAALEAINMSIHRIGTKHAKELANLQANLDFYKAKLKDAGISLTGGRRKLKK